MSVPQEPLCAMAVKTTVRARVPALASADPTKFEHMSPYHNLGIHIETSPIETLPICVECGTSPIETSQLTHYACAVQVPIHYSAGTPYSPSYHMQAIPQCDELCTDTPPPETECLGYEQSSQYIMQRQPMQYVDPSHMVTQYQRTAKPYTDSAQHIQNRRVANPAVRR